MRPDLAAFLLILTAAAAPARVSRHTPRSFADAVRAARPGDTLLLEKGVYGRISISCSGEKNAPLTIKAAPGARPVFDGSAVHAWKRFRGEIFIAPLPQPPLTVIVDNAVMPRVDGPESLVQGSYAYAGGAVYLWCPRGGDPARHETGVLLDDRKKLIEISGNYVVLDSILARFSSGSGIAVTGKYCEVRSSEVKWSAGNGLRFYRPASHGRAVSNDVHDNFCNNFVRGSRDGGWGYGLGTAAQVPDCEFTGNRSYRNNGEGLGCYNQSDRTVMRGNIVYDNWSVNIYIDSAADCIVDGNMVYNTGRVPSPDLRRSRPVGIMCADEVYAGGPYLTRLTVINNIVTACQRGFSFSRWRGAMPGSVLKESLIANNTFIDNDTGISLAETADTTVIANNIVLQNNGKSCVAAPNGDAAAVNPHWLNNVFFGSEPRSFEWPSRALDFAGWVATLARTSGCVWADPRLAATSGFDPRAFRLRPGSICIDAGTPVKHVDHDAAGTRRPQGKGYDAGAIER